MEKEKDKEKERGKAKEPRWCKKACATPPLELF